MIQELLVRAEYKIKIDTSDFEIEDGDGKLHEPDRAELCQMMHGMISEDPRGIQDIIEDVDSKRVTLVVSPA